jgi:glycosyltransferase involved in cell wall biosynthesis
MSSNKILILFTDGYPYDSSDIHMEKEMGFLFKAFDKIYIFCQHVSTEIVYELPSNTTVFSAPFTLKGFQKLKIFRFIFSSVFIEEIGFMITQLLLFPTFRRIKYLLSEINKAYVLQKLVIDKIEFEFHEENHIYIYSFWNNYKAMTSAFLKKRFPFVKSFSRAHGWDVYFERMPGNYLPGKSFLLKNLDAIYYISEHGYLYSRKKFGNFPNLKISRLGTFNEIVPDFKKGPNPLHLVSCSYIVPLKRLELIIQALSTIDGNYSIKWTHIGDGPLASKMKSLATDVLYSKKNISYHFTGHIPNNEVLDFLRTNNVNLFINVSTTEGIPVTIMEAMSCGIPCIATAVGGTPEIVNNENGFLLNSNPSPEEIAKNILEYYNLNEEGTTKKRKSAYQMWFDNYNAGKNYQDFISQII